MITFIDQYVSLHPLIRFQKEDSLPLPAEITTAITLKMALIEPDEKVDGSILEE